MSQGPSPADSFLQRILQTHLHSLLERATFKPMTSPIVEIEHQNYKGYQRIMVFFQHIPNISKHDTPATVRLHESHGHLQRQIRRLFRLCYGSMDALRCHGHPKLAFPKSLVSQADDTKTAQPPDGIWTEDPNGQLEMVKIWSSNYAIKLYASLWTAWLQRLYRQDHHSNHIS